MKIIRLIHNLPRSGGTIISKCISAQKDVVLLSEIHPDGNEMIKKMFPKKNISRDPISQSVRWYNLFTSSEIEEFKNKKLNFEDKIEIILKKCEINNKKLVIRDWSYLDYLSLPYKEPSFENKLYNVLSKKYQIYNFSVIRHPIEIYLSMINRVRLIRENYQSINIFLPVYIKYCKFIKKFNYYKFEDFCLSVDQTVKKMCSSLKLEFNHEYKKKLKDIKITGDPGPVSSIGISKIKERRFTSFSNIELENIMRNHEFKQISNLLNYH